eukprot:UN03664
MMIHNGTLMTVSSRYTNVQTSKQEANEFIKSGDIVMFSKTSCGFCVMAKSILSKYSNDYNVMELNKIQNGYEIQDYLYTCTGSSTVPQIFIHQKYVGGCKDILRLHSDDELQQIIDND